MYCFVCLRIDYSGFSKRAINQAIMTRQLILSTRGSQKIHNSIKTPPCTFRQLWYNVAENTDNIEVGAVPLVQYHSVFSARPSLWYGTLIQCSQLILVWGMGHWYIDFQRLFNLYCWHCISCSNMFRRKKKNHLNWRSFTTTTNSKYFFQMLQVFVWCDLLIIDFMNLRVWKLKFYQ